MTSFVKSLVLAALAGPLVAHALVVNISGQGAADGEWDVTTVTGSPDALLPTLDDQVWWGDNGLALSFMSTVGTALGLPNIGTVGPLFITAGTVGSAANLGGCAYVSSFSNPLFCGVIAPGPTATFALAERVSAVPEPASLLLAGVALVALVAPRRARTA